MILQFLKLKRENYFKNFVIIFLLLLFTICNVNFSFCSSDNNDFPSGDNRNIIVLVVGGIILICLIIYSYSNINPPPPPSITFVESLLSSSHSPDINPIEPVHEPVHESVDLAPLISRISHEDNFQIGLILLGGFVSIILVIGGVISVFRYISNWVNNYLNININLDLTRDRVINRARNIHTENAVERMRERDRVFNHNQDILIHYANIQMNNGFLTLEELQQLNMLNVDSLNTEQQELFNELNRLNSFI